MEDVPPVRDPAKSGYRIGTHFRKKLVIENGKKRTAYQNNQDNGGKKPSYAPQPKLRQVNGTCVVDLNEEQRGDQVARKHEEDRNT